MRVCFVSVHLKSPLLPWSYHHPSLKRRQGGMKLSLNSQATPNRISKKQWTKSNHLPSKLILSSFQPCVTSSQRQSTWRWRITNSHSTPRRTKAKVTWWRTRQQKKTTSEKKSHWYQVMNAAEQYLASITITEIDTGAEVQKPILISHDRLRP